MLKSNHLCQLLYLFIYLDTLKNKRGKAKHILSRKLFSMLLYNSYFIKDYYLSGMN